MTNAYLQHLPLGPLPPLTLVGVAHSSAPIAVRECFSLTAAQQQALLESYRAEGISAALVICTCNRTEVLAATEDVQLLESHLLQYAHGQTTGALAPYLCIWQGWDAVQHLFEVALGMDSQVIGDLQVIHQVKQAFQLAQALSLAPGWLERLFQAIFTAHKRSRKETQLGQGAASLAHAAVQYAQAQPGGLIGKQVLLLGAGKVGASACKNLQAAGAAAITVINRTQGRAQELAARWGASWQPYDELPQALAAADVVLVATGAAHPTITPKMLSAGKSKLVLDLSVPRNVAPEVAALAGIMLVNVDELKQRADAAQLQRKAALAPAREIIKQEAEAYLAWLAQRKVGPVYQLMVTRLAAITQQELAHYRRRMPDVDLALVDAFAASLVDKIAQQGIIYMREHAHTPAVSSLVDHLLEKEQLA